MKLKNFTKKKAVAFGLAFGVAAGAGGIAAAYFTSSGSGTGHALTATASSLKIQQIGAGYDSVVSTNGYIQDQCFTCANITAFGNRVTLKTTTTSQQLVTVVVAVRNWGPKVTQPVTFTVETAIAGPVTDTQTFTFTAAAVAGVEPTVTNITFNFATQGAFVKPTFTYKITGLSGSLNVALSNSAHQLLVGSDATPGHVWLTTTDGPGIAGDFPACTTPPAAGTYGPVTTNCGPASPNNPGAYGTTAQVTKTGNADIPAVEVNVVGGAATGLYPGGPAQPVNFAVSNAGQSAVHLNQVMTSVSTVGTAGTSNPVCTPATYGVTNPTRTLNQTVKPGTTLIAPSGVFVHMNTNGKNQDNCEGGTIALAFTSN